MFMTAHEYRREARLVEQAANVISLQSDKEELLATARSLRLQADAMETQFDGSPNARRTAAKPV